MVDGVLMARWAVRRLSRRFAFLNATGRREDAKANYWGFAPCREARRLRSRRSAAPDSKIELLIFASSRLPVALKV
jgi:hypothetical protein